MTDRRVSVVIAAYNVGPYVAETVKSALGQTHADREIIVVDDGSTDDTAERLAPYLSQIRFVRQEHAGLAAARNHALRLADGDYIALLDADDVWMPTKLAVQVEIAARRPKCGMVVCDGYEFDGAAVLQPNLFQPYVLDMLKERPDGEVAGSVHESMIHWPMIACPGQTLIPRAVIDRLGWFVDSRAQDYDYYLRIAQRYPIVFHRHILAGWRYRRDSMSGLRRMRVLTWVLYMLPILGVHAARCESQSDRELVIQAIDRHTREIIDAVTLMSTIGGPEQ
jgi:glycosyltransferase involved in cell wall biosynthesis